MSQHIDRLFFQYFFVVKFINCLGAFITILNPSDPKKQKVNRKYDKFC